MDAVEKPLFHFQINGDNIPIFDFDDPVWNNPENYYPVEFLPQFEIKVHPVEVKQDEAGTEKTFPSVTQSHVPDGFRLSEYIVLDSAIHAMASALITSQEANPTSSLSDNSSVDFGQIKFFVFSSPTGIVVSVKGIRYKESLRLDVWEFLSLFKFIFSLACLKMKEDKFVYGTEKNRKDVHNPSFPGIMVVNPTLLCHWTKIYDIPMLRLVRHGPEQRKPTDIYVNMTHLDQLYDVGLCAVVKKIIAYQNSSVDLPDFFPTLVDLHRNNR